MPLPFVGEGQDRGTHGPSSAGRPLTLSLSRKGRGDLSPHSRQGYMQVRPALAAADSPPELLCCQACALRHRLKFGPHNGGMDLRVIGGLRGEAAIGPSDHVLPAHQFGIADDALSDEFGVFDDVARVSDYPWDEHLAYGQFHVFPDVVLMLVTRVGSLEGVGACIYFQHRVQDVLKRRVVDPRPFIDPVAGVEAHLLRGDTSQAMVERLNIQLGPLAPLGYIQRWITVDICEEGVVDLYDEAGFNNRLVLCVHGLCHRVQVFLFGAVVFVRAHAAWCYGGHEDLLGLYPFESSFEVVEVSLNGLLSPIADRSGAHQRDHRGD